MLQSNVVSKRPNASAAPPTSAPNVNIGSSAVSSGMQDTQSASALLQLYTNTVLQTPIIKLDPSVDTDSKSTVVELLPQHQQTAQANAQYYLNTINPLIVSTVADIIGFANLWNAEFQLLVSLANTIDQGNNKQLFIEGIQNLINKTQSAGSNVTPVLNALNAFLPLVQTDVSNLNGDLANVKAALSGQSGQIAQLQQQLDAYNSAMNKDLAIIAGGAVADVVGVLMITVGVLAEIETAGVSTALVVGGLAVVGGGTAAIIIASKNLNASQSQYASTLATLNNDEAVFSLTTQASTSINSLISAIQSGVTAVEALQAGWSALGSDFGQVVQALQSATPGAGSWLVPLLESANSDWQTTLTLATNLQQNGTLPVQKQSMAYRAKNVA